MHWWKLVSNLVVAKPLRPFRRDRVRLDLSGSRLAQLHLLHRLGRCLLHCACRAQAALAIYVDVLKLYVVVLPIR